MPKNKKISILKEMGYSGSLNENGELVFRKIGISAQRIKTDIAFQRTRENGAEFGYAARVGKLIRHALNPALVNISNPGLTGHLVKMMMTLIQTDSVNPRGQRSILNARLDLLKGYELNERKQSWATSFPLVYRFNKTKNQLSVKMKSIKRPNAYRQPPDAFTHVRIYPILAVFNPCSQAQQSFYEPRILPVSIAEEDIPPQQLTADITISGPGIIITAICTEFFSCHNNNFSPHKGKFNTLTIVNAFTFNQ